MKPKPVVASSAARVTPRLLSWSAYAPAVKCELFSSAYRAAEGWVVIDPIALAPEAWEEVAEGVAPVAVFLTNGNHARASDLWRAKWKVPVHAPAAAVAELETSADHLFAGAAPVHGLRPIAIPGATEGETAFLSPEGILILGDAVINLESEGLALLPKKYCWNEPASRASLKKLLDYDFSLVSFAHGTPLRTQAHERLRLLLA